MRIWRAVLLEAVFVSRGIPSLLFLFCFGLHWPAFGQGYVEPAPLPPSRYEQAPPSISPGRVSRALDSEVAGHFDVHETAISSVNHAVQIVEGLQVAEGPQETVPGTAPLSSLEITLGPSYAEAIRLRQAMQEDAGQETFVPVNDESPVDLTADDMSHDQKNQIITASGNVVLRQSGRVLRAGAIQYDLGTDTATATDDVVYMDPDGDIHFADHVILSNEMRDGFVQGLQSYLADGGRLRAEEARRVDARVTTLDNASYTPCECELDQARSPAWQIRAREVTYHEDENRISYRNARFEMFGVPVLWTPYLSHPDGKVQRKSGLLTPSFGYDSQLGAMITNEYYVDIAQNRDATFGIMAMTREAPVLLGQYRHRFEQASLLTEGSVTWSTRTDDVEGRDVRQDEELRGHLFADALWNIDDQWRAGLNLELSSDDQYLRQYKVTNKDVLENEIYAERFAGRNYAVGRMLAFKDVRIQERQTDQPNIIPELYAGFIGEPNATLGGRWDLQLAGLGLVRDGEGRDMARTISRLGWQRRDVSGFGLVTTTELAVRGDLYHVRESDTDPGQDATNTIGRAFPRAHIVSSYPLARPMENAQIMIEPIASLTVAPDIDSAGRNIPNEDSEDAQIDASNLFRADRFPGYDRVEDRSRVTYGLRSGLYGYRGSHLEGFLGQSYRMSTNDNPFPQGSGLTGQNSDVVGQISALYDGRAGLNYRFQLDSDSLSSQRHEFDGYLRWHRLNVNGRYLFAKALEGTDFTESREQIDVAAALGLTRHWRVRGSAIYDLGEDDPGLRRTGFGLDYFGCCMTFSTTVERRLTREASGESNLEIMFRVGLRGLGEFATSDDGDWGRIRYVD